MDEADQILSRLHNAFQRSGSITSRDLDFSLGILDKLQVDVSLHGVPTTAGEKYFKVSS